MKHVVRFVRAWSPYQVGDLAGFNESRARALVKAGFATKHGTADVSGESALEKEVEDEMKKLGGKNPALSKLHPNNPVNARSDDDEGEGAEGDEEAPDADDKPEKVRKNKPTGKPPGKKARNRIIDSD